MNDLLNEFRIQSGISRLEDDPRLIVIDKEGNAIDPLIGLQKFAELIIKECLDIMKDEKHNTTMLLSNPKQSGAIYDAMYNIKSHFGVK